uniref:Tryptophan synthase beta chain-like PALP domain-containing protein n=1 Tax=Zea mays TaxID=4577 RepID=A0A804R112_MAIZE
MAGEEAGRRGVPSLLNPPSASSEGQQEHIASDVTQLIGWTPLVELKRIAAKEGVCARIVGKVEAYQPLCSVKDRSALRMIEDAEERGLISPGTTTLVEPTSGNLGLGLVLVALRKGYRAVRNRSIPGVPGHNRQGRGAQEGAAQRARPRPVLQQSES